MNILFPQLAEGESEGDLGEGLIQCGLQRETQKPRDMLFIQDQP